MAQSLNNLANLYQDQRRYAEALPLYQRSLAIREQGLGPMHPDVAIVLHHRASLYQAQGQYAEALPLYERAVKINERAMPDHPNTATYLEHLAVLLRQMEREDEASALEEHVQTIYVRREESSQPQRIG